MTQENDNDERYFFILWKLDGSDTIHDIPYTTKKGKFFNPDYVFKGFRKDTSNIQIINWKEFKNREDYDDFTKNYKEYWSDLHNKPASQCNI